MTISAERWLARLQGPSDAVNELHSAMIDSDFLLPAVRLRSEHPDLARFLCRGLV